MTTTTSRSTWIHRSWSQRSNFQYAGYVSPLLGMSTVIMGTGLFGDDYLVLAKIFSVISLKAREQNSQL